MTLRFSGQPSIWDSAVGTKHIVYEAFCADGSCLPPVIFTSSEKVIAHDKRMYNPGSLERPAFVVHIPNLGAPSSDSTVAWVEKMTGKDANYLDDDSLLILDSLPGHFSENSKNAFDDIDATLYRLPAASGKWLNPCDQAINREMRRMFLKLQRQNRNRKVENIIEAYYSIKSETIIASFDRCGLFAGDPEDIISRQADQGFHPTLSRKEAVDEYNKEFCAWMHQHVRHISDVLPRSRNTTELDSTLDGKQWKTYGSACRRVCSLHE